MAQTHAVGMSGGANQPKKTAADTGGNTPVLGAPAPDPTRKAVAMSASTAIGMVSASLRNLLVGEMRLTPAPDVTVLAPDEAGGGNRRVNLFLYKLVENPFLKNQDVTVRAGTPNVLVSAPLSLSLFYLLTPYAPNDPLTGNATAHQILGEAMRVLYENPVVPTNYLDTGLTDARERLQIASNTLDPEELSRIWTTFSQPFRLSVMYEVSTVQLDRLPQAQRPLPNRVRRVGPLAGCHGAHVHGRGSRRVAGQRTAARRGAAQRRGAHRRHVPRDRPGRRRARLL